MLKEALIQAPILVYPRFNSAAPPFSLQTDASSVDIRGVLEQEGHVIAYASRSLMQAKRNYSVIQPGRSLWHEEISALTFEMRLHLGHRP